jgi:L-ascorbate metabolism protein UlaG (beta-lactamase superfamily)
LKKLSLLLIIIFTIVFVNTDCYAKSDQKVEVTFIANAGFLITSQSKKVLIDALFNQGMGFGQPSKEILEKLKNAQPPFDDVDLVLVTHSHPDHFNARFIIEHLESNQKAVFVAPKQVINNIEVYLEESSENIINRIMEITPEWKTCIGLTINGIELKVIGLQHWIPHLGAPYINGYICTIGGKNVLHIGDAGSELEYIKDISELHNLAIDIAFVADIWSENDETSIKKFIEYINPKHVIYMHLGPFMANTMITEELKGIKANLKFKNIIIFEDELDTKIFK